MRASTSIVLCIAAISCSSVFSQMDTVLLSSAPFNSEGNEFAVRKFQDALVFVGIAKDENGNKILDRKTGEPFTDLYLYKDGKVSTFEIPNVAGVSLNASSYYFDGPFSSSEAGDILFFSNNIPGGKEKNTLGIFFTTKQEKGYSDPLPLHFNSEHYNTTHPFYDEATKYVYFASDKDSGLGGMDVYRVKFENNAFGEVETLNFNSTENDAFPSVYNGVVYIASNRVGSKGGYDLYKYSKGVLQNLGQPFNSEYDDLGITWMSESNGYFSTNRPFMDNLVTQTSTGQFQDDVYAFEVKKTKTIVSINLLLTDKDGMIIKDAVVTLNDAITGELKFNGMSNAEGIVTGVADTLLLNGKASYKMNINKEGIASSEKVIEVNATNNKSVIDNSSVDIKIQSLSKEMEITELLELKTIYYDFNSSLLRPEAKTELDKVIRFMNLHPEVVVELGSYTDCKGSEEYNMWLAKKRASVAGDYIKQRIASRKNLTSIGYGENNPKLNCDCDEPMVNPCSEADLQLNRRTEFKISALKFSTGKK